MATEGPVTHRQSSGPSLICEDTHRFTRKEAVERQLIMAVRARLAFGDLVSALTLAGAAERVLSDLQPKDARVSEGHYSIKAALNESVDDTAERKRLATMAREAYDQLRHADTKSDHTHEIHREQVDALIAMAIEALHPRSRNDDIVAWLYTLPPILGAFSLFGYLVYPMAAAARSRGDPESVYLCEQIRTSPPPELFEGLVEIIQSKSLIPNPKSPTAPRRS